MEMTTPERRELDQDRHERQLDDAWRSCGPAAMRFATALVGPQDAHDVTTNAFLRVTRQDHWTDIEHLDRYLLRAVSNEAQNLYRDRRRRWQRDLQALAADPQTDLAADLDVVRAIGALTVQQRCVVFLAYWHDMTEAEIAQTLDLARSTIHRNLVRARIQLRKALK